MTETNQYALDPLEQAQEEMYSKIADYIMKRSVIHGIGKSADEMKKYRQVINELREGESIEGFVFAFLENAAEKTDFQNVHGLAEFYEGADIIDFKKLYKYQDETLGASDSSEESLERAKALLIPLIEEEITTQKLICMLCYCETHKKFKRRLYDAFEEMLVNAPGNHIDGRCNTTMFVQAVYAGREYVSEAKKKCTEKINEWYREYFASINEDDIPIVNLDYSIQEFEADYKEHFAKWYNDSPLSLKKLKGIKDWDQKYYAVVKEGLLAWESDELFLTGKYKGLSNYLTNFISACGFDNVFAPVERPICIPKVLFKETLLTLAQMKDHKYFGLKDRWSNINTKDAIRTFGNMYFLYLEILQMLTKLKPDWGIDVKLQIKKSLSTSSLPLYLSAYVSLITTEEPTDNYIMQAKRGAGRINDFNAKDIKDKLRITNFQKLLGMEEHTAFVQWLHNAM